MRLKKGAISLNNPMQIKLQILGKSYKPLCFVENKLLVYHLHTLYLMDTNDYTVQTVCSLKLDDPRKWACFCSFGERASHISVYCGIEVDGGAIVAFNRGIYFVDVKNKVVSREKTFDPPDMRRPLNFFNISGLKSFDEMIVYADYSFNPSRKPMSIYRRCVDGKWDGVYTFPANRVRHIHSIISDPYRDRVIILTGDFGEECGIWEAKDNFKSVRLIMGGMQKYRACCARAYKRGIVIVTDSPFDQNYIYFIKENEFGLIETEILGHIDGPVVFFTNYGQDMIFSTDVEYDERRGTGAKRLLSYKKAPGCKDWFTHMYMGNPDKGFTEIRRYRKDIFPMASFGFGNISFPNGEIKGKLFYYPVNVKKYGSRLCLLKDKKLN